MRTIQAPGIQVTELDRSGYADTTDNSITNTASFILGFTDKGQDYEKKYVNSMATYEKMFGVPSNEAEKYTYNAVFETISRGGNAYVAKLPYDNEVLNKFSYTKYQLETELNLLSSPYDIISNNRSGIANDITLKDFMLMPNIDTRFSEYIIDELYELGILTENEETLFVEDNGEINLIDFFNKSGIKLSVITELFDHLQDVTNLQYSTRKAVKDIFYNNEEYCRNDAVYMLCSLNIGVDELTKWGISQQKIDSYRSELEDVRQSVMQIGDFNEQIAKFGKIKSLKYYRDYLTSLYTEVEKSSYEGGESKKSFVMNLIDSFDKELMHKQYSAVKFIDETLTSYMSIKSLPQSESDKIEMDDYDKFKIGTTRPIENQIQIIDITRGKYQSEVNIIDKSNPMEYVGILPVITTPVNALYTQGIISRTENDFREYCALSDIQNIASDDRYYDEEYEKWIDVKCQISNMNNDNTEIIGFNCNIGGEILADETQQTLSKTSVQMFPNILFNNGRLERKYLKCIGVVVFEMYIDRSADNKIGFAPVESYVGSLNRREIDSDTNASMFIDNIVNSNSKRINLFSNIRFSENQNVAIKDVDKASIFAIQNQTATSLGFYSKDTSKKISVNKSILNAIDMIFFNAKDINTFEIDIVVDAGVSNIAQFIQSIYGSGKGYYDLSNVKSNNFGLVSMEQTKKWRLVLNKYDDFCKNVRKDCIFIADGMRPLCLNGNEKRVRNTKPENTIDNTVLKDIKWMQGQLNSSYSAGYCDWFYTIDRYTKDYFWCPPSIKANGIYINTDAYANYWDAPAGMNRGVLPSDVIDVAFNPTNEEAGVIYNTQWNYAISYPINGIVQEGQRTFQRNKTALDRVNVRRLMLGLEKRVRYVAKYFTYEGITDYMMSRFRDSVTYIMEDAKNKGGILDYYVICDSRNNNIQTIENNELHCTIAVKPVKSAEFICLNFIATSQGANVQEVAESEM